MELSKARGDYEIDKIPTLLNEIYDTGQIPPDISKSIFIALPMNPGATKCELHTYHQNIFENHHYAT